jgi:hypothetical protein
MDHINNKLLGRQIGEVYKWLCFVNYICLKTDQRFGSKLDDIHYILELVSENKSVDISETAQWWEQFYESSNCNEYASNLIRNIRNAGSNSLLGLLPHKRRSLAFYFSEFRGLALSLRAARDSEGHHISQGETSELFSVLYGAIALRILDISKLLSDLVCVIAKANPEITQRFGFRLITASDAELQSYRDITASLGSWPSTCRIDAGQATGSVDAGAADGHILDASSEHIRGLMQDLREAMAEDIARLQSEVLAKLDAAVRAGSLQRQGTGNAEGLLATTGQQSALLSPEELARELLDVRDQIYTAMSARFTGFEHWHNILQRPIIAEICRSGCETFEDVKELPGFRSRIIQANHCFSLEEQEVEFADAINQILGRVKKQQ